MNYHFQYLRTYLIIKRKQWLDKLSRDKSNDYTPFAILCEPRSGSTLLHTYLNSHSEVQSYGEVLRRAIEKNSSKPLPDDFVSSLAFKPHPKNIKAVGLKLFYEYYNDPRYNDSFNIIIKRKDIKIIHLVRKDTLRIYVSLKIAQKTNIWSANKNTKSKDTRITIDVKEYEQFVARHKQHQLLFAELFKDHRQITIWYEDLVNDPKNTLNHVQQFLGVRPRKLFTLLKRQNPQPLPALIENYHEIEPLLQQE